MGHYLTVPILQGSTPAFLLSYLSVPESGGTMGAFIRSVLQFEIAEPLLNRVGGTDRRLCRRRCALILASGSRNSSCPTIRGSIELGEPLIFKIVANAWD
jgi:hypothetical protein